MIRAANSLGRDRYRERHLMNSSFLSMVSRAPRTLSATPSLATLLNLGGHHRLKRRCQEGVLPGRLHRFFGWVGQGARGDRRQGVLSLLKFLQGGQFGYHYQPEWSLRL